MKLKKIKLPPILLSAAAILFWCIIWQIGALLVGSEFILPSPISVIGSLSVLIFKSEFWLGTLLSLCRIIAGYIIGAILAIPLGILTHNVRGMGTLFSPLLTVIRTTPVASFILLAFFWLTSGTIPIFISALMVLPIVWSGTVRGLESVSPELKEMVKVFGFSFSERVRELYIPSVIPSLKASLVTSVGLSWKAGIAAEVLATPRVSIGRYMYESRIYFETTELFAWTVAVIALSLLIEKLLSALIMGKRGAR